MRLKENEFHKFHSPKKPAKMQKQFCFFDTESQIIKQTQDETLQSFRLGTVIYWNTETNEEERLIFKDINVFWEFIEKHLTSTLPLLTVFAHNLQFDMTMTDAFNALKERDWELLTMYSKGQVTIFTFRKLGWITKRGEKRYFTLKFWDTTNFAPDKSVKDIGESMNLPKLEINFDTCSEEYLAIYCMRDSEIIFQYIKKCVEFLKEHKLGKLKPTLASLGMNAYRTRFIRKKGLWIHKWDKAIQLERSSYRGGITDVFYHNTPVFCYKTDINSMYPAIMRNELLPCRLICYTTSNLRSQEALFKLMDISHKKRDGVIAEITYSLPESYPYILQRRKSDKHMVFLYGKKMRGAFCSPELKYILKHGKIHKIHRISVYDMDYVFKDYVEFFYQFKQLYSINENWAFREFSKRYMTNLYGKFGQKQLEFRRMKEDFYKKHRRLLLSLIAPRLEEKSKLIYLCIVDGTEVYLFENSLFVSYQTDLNSYDSFVALSSFITSHARIKLMKLREISGEKETYYCDTDSLFISEKGLNNLKAKGLIDELELGALKIEGIGVGIFYNPKFYDFKENGKVKRRIKGVNIKSSKKKLETNTKVKYRVELWERLKSRLKSNRHDVQLIKKTFKTVSKIYSKGLVMSDHWTKPSKI